MIEQSNIEFELKKLMTAKELNEKVLRTYSMYQYSDGLSWHWKNRAKPTEEQAADYIQCLKGVESFYEGHRQDLSQDDVDEMELRIEEYCALTLDMRDVVFEENGKVGLKNPLGFTLVPAQFDAIPECYCCIDQRWGKIPFCVPVVKDGKYGLYRYNREKDEGRILTKKLYHKIYRYFSLRVPYFVCENDEGKVGLLDTLMAHEVIPCKQDEIYEAKDSDGCVVFRNGKNYGLMFGNVATKSVFHDIELASEDYCRVRFQNDDKWYFLDEDGNTTLDNTKAFFGTWYDTTK